MYFCSRNKAWSLDSDHLGCPFNLPWSLFFPSIKEFAPNQNGEHCKIWEELAYQFFLFTHKISMTSQSDEDLGRRMTEGSVERNSLNRLFSICYFRFMLCPLLFLPCAQGGWCPRLHHSGSLSLWLLIGISQWEMPIGYYTQSSFHHPPTLKPPCLAELQLVLPWFPLSHAPVRQSTSHSSAALLRFWLISPPVVTLGLGRVMSFKCNPRCFSVPLPFPLTLISPLSIVPSFNFHPLWLCQLFPASILTHILFWGQNSYHIFQHHHMVKSGDMKIFQIRCPGLKGKILKT